MSKNLIKILQNGQKMPMIGLGTAETLLEKEKMYELIKSAFDKGYRHIDTAILYQNHELLGYAFNRIFNIEKLYQRDDIFITSKIFPMKNENTKDQLAKALKDLNLEYLNLFLVHTPIFTPEGTNEILLKPQHVIWKEMENLVHDGYVKSIGVSNYNVQSIYNTLSFCEIRPQVNQVEIHPFLMQFNLRKFCNEQNIAITGYGNLARGGLDVKQQVGHKIDLFNNPLLKQLQEKYKAPISQIVLNYLAIEEDVIVIPKTENIDRLDENISFDHIKISQEDINQLKQLDQGIRTLDSSTLQQWNYTDIFA